MKYLVTVADRTFEVTVTDGGVLLDGAPLAARLTAVPDAPLYQLHTERAARAYALRRGAEGWSVARGGESWSVRVRDERTRALEQLRERRTGPDAPGVVRAPMPGLVLRIEVEVGQAVPAGGGLVVLEAMKMENEIRATAAGTVRAILVEPGQAVEKGASLLEIS